MSYDSNRLCLPNIKWLGVLQDDLKKFQLSRECFVPLTAEDQKKGEDMLKRKDLQTKPLWKFRKKKKKPQNRAHISFFFFLLQARIGTHADFRNESRNSSLCKYFPLVLE
jgi:DNA topoisomerase VI subunit A